MAALRFSLAQIEAFTSVAEEGNLTRAAKKLGKDRTTLSQLLEYLELDLGYSLFDRSTRPLALTDEGVRLYRQARLFLLEAQAFNRTAENIPQQITQRLVIAYDNFMPRDTLVKLTAKLAQHHILVDLLCQPREQCEAALERGEVNIGLYQAMNRAISDRFKWRATGSVELAAYAARGVFASQTAVSMLTLASTRQLMPFIDLPTSMAQRLQVADSICRVNDLALLQPLLSAGACWALLPLHFGADHWPDIERLDTELGNAGLTHPLVALWLPCSPAQPAIDQLLRLIGEC
jgi:DNA-binding transcriptional LysR family regulator